jgi:predicted RNA-binding Zn ribbon-like protein
VSWRLDPARREDRLAGGPDLVDWFATVGDLSAADRDRLARQAVDHPELAEKVLQAVKRLRAASIRVLDAHLGDPSTGTADDLSTGTADVELIAVAWRRALAVATTSERLPWRWRVEPSDLASLEHVLALTLADLLHRSDQARLRRCDGDGCGWLFLDTTRNRSRRWCDPLDCGNRARVRSYVERHRSADRDRGSR